MALPYDVITVGGGLAGSALAKCLAERGYRVRPPRARHARLASWKDCAAFISPMLSARGEIRSA